MNMMKIGTHFEDVVVTRRVVSFGADRAGFTVIPHDDISVWTNSDTTLEQRKFEKSEIYSSKLNWQINRVRKEAARNTKST